MTRVVLDDTLQAKLNGLAAGVELCDETGRIVGHFLPQETYLRLVYGWANAQTTDEELDRISQEPGGRTLGEIWKSLEQP